MGMRSDYPLNRTTSISAFFTYIKGCLKVSMVFTQFQTILIC